MRKQNSIPLGRILGIPIGLDWSWFLIFALMTFSLASNYYPLRFDGWPVWLYWAAGAASVVLLFVSVLLHELGHSVAALGFRIPVRRIRLMIFGGVAELGDESPSSVAEFVIAIAGPLVSIALAGTLGAAWIVLGFYRFYEPLVALLGYLATINLSLAVFNLIPGFPLDGGRVLRAILWGVIGDMRRATQIAANVGRLVSFGFIGLGVLQGVTGNIGSGLWTAFIGIFLQGAANAELQAVTMRRLLAGRTVAQLMSSNFTTLPGDLTLQRLVDAHILGSGRRTFVVVEDGHVAGLLSLEHVRQVPPEHWPYTTIARAMMPLKDLQYVGPDMELWPALLQMEREEVSQLPVVQNGRLLGLLSRDDLLRFVHTLHMLGPQMARS